MRENKNVIGVKNSSMPVFDIQGFVRDRDSMEQVRIPIADLKAYFEDKFRF